MVWGESDEGGDVDVWAKVVLDKDALKSEGSDISDEEGIKVKLDSLLAEINNKMPSFKAIKYFIFGEEDMEKTTTKKIKRNIELESIKEIIRKNKLKIKEAAGKNIDALKNMIINDGKQESDIDDNPDIKSTAEEDIKAENGNNYKS